MRKMIFKFIAVVGLMVVCANKVYCQEALWKQAAEYEKNGNYQETIRLKKIMANEDKGTEWYIDDIAGIARCYFYTNNTDSTILYCNQLIGLADQLIGKSDSIAEIYIQTATWCLFNCNQYAIAINASEKVFDLRGKIYGVGSQEQLDWLSVMISKSSLFNDIDRLMRFCKTKVEITEQVYGKKSIQFSEAISSILDFGRQIVVNKPQSITEWFLPIYNEILSNDTIPKFQYEFEIILLEGFLTMRNLQSADYYAEKLKWRCIDAIIPLKDVVRISLTLANYYLNIGNHVKSRSHVDKAWKMLSEAKVKPSVAQLIDRHIIERQLKMDSLGNSRINAEWLIETSIPIVKAGIEADGTIAFFYESCAWAYESLEDYDSAIENINKSILLSPSLSRKKKLAQLYLHKQQYDLAEQQYLELIEDSTISGQWLKDIVSDLTFLYWTCNKREHLELLLDCDFENKKNEVRNAFAFMNEFEREIFLSKTLLGNDIEYDFYTGYSKDGNQWTQGNIFAYNLALVKKGLLLNTSRDIMEILSNAPDSLQEKKKLYDKFQQLSIPNVELPAAREIRLDLMRYVSQQPNFLNQLNLTWSDVKKGLKDGEAAIEFINLLGITPENCETENPRPGIGALIIKKNSNYPVFVNLADNSQIDSLFIFDEYGNCLYDEIYGGAVKYCLYKAIWKPMEQYLQDVETVYYAPCGYLQSINLDWLGESEEENLSNRYKLYRLSSTGQLCQLNEYTSSKNATLYGNIQYSLNVPILKDKTNSKLRSTTRNGFMPLSGTAVEIDSIDHEFKKKRYKSSIISTKYATEKSLRDLSGKSPYILHFATHGFYFSQEMAQRIYDTGGGFIAFQTLNPELFRSGLALAGAQDNWNIKDVDKYLDLDQKNDGILLSSEISQIDLSNTDLVILSACETALGKVTSEGVYGLQRAFKLAGVNSIIMSLWKVDDDATQLLMTEFYKFYLGGMSKREALLNAQKAVMSTPGFEAPEYWAAFILLDGIN